jgi:hypothetical protein
MTISAPLFFRALPPEGGVGGEERPDSLERRGELHRSAGAKAEDREPEEDVNSGFAVTRLRFAGSGLYGSAAHRAAGGLNNAPAACGRLRKPASVRIL